MLHVHGALHNASNENEFQAFIVTFTELLPLEKLWNELIISNEKRISTAAELAPVIRRDVCGLATRFPSWWTPNCCALKSRNLVNEERKILLAKRFTFDAIVLSSAESS